MKLRCKREAIDENGTKVMEFTKGRIYEAQEAEEECFDIVDDMGNKETFFRIDIMFEKI